MPITQKILLILYSISLPSAGIGFFLIFLTVSPGAYDQFVSQLARMNCCCLPMFTGVQSRHNIRGYNYGQDVKGVTKVSEQHAPLKDPSNSHPTSQHASSGARNNKDTTTHAKINQKLLGRNVNSYLLLVERIFDTFRLISYFIFTIFFPIGYFRRYFHTVQHTAYVSSSELSGV